MLFGVGVEKGFEVRGGAGVEGSQQARGVAGVVRAPGLAVNPARGRLHGGAVGVGHQQAAFVVADFEGVGGAQARSGGGQKQPQNRPGDRQAIGEGRALLLDQFEFAGDVKVRPGAFADGGREEDFLREARGGDFVGEGGGNERLEIAGLADFGGGGAGGLELREARLDFRALLGFLHAPEAGVEGDFLFARIGHAVIRACPRAAARFGVIRNGARKRHKGDQPPDRNRLLRGGRAAFLEGAHHGDMQVARTAGGAAFRTVVPVFGHAARERHRQKRRQRRAGAQPPGAWENRRIPRFADHSGKPFLSENRMGSGKKRSAIKPPVTQVRPVTIW